MVLNCSACTRPIDDYPLSIRCGDPFHVACLYKIITERRKKVARSSIHRRKRERVRGRIGCPLSWSLPPCPVCGEYMTLRDVRKVKKIQRQILEEEEDRTPSPTPSLQEMMDALSEESD